MNTAAILLLLLQGGVSPPVFSARAAPLFRASAAAGSFRAQARP